MFSQLAEVKMTEEKSEEIWSYLERNSLNSDLSAPHRKRRFNRFGPIGAVSVALLLFIGGLSTARHRFPQLGHTSASSTTSSSSATTASASASGSASEQASQVANQPTLLPFEVVTANWRLVVFRTLLLQGSYYDVQLYYAGKKPISLSKLNISWNGIRTQPGTASPIQPGTLVSGFIAVPFKNGFADISPFKVSWAQDGHNYSETLTLSSGAKHDLQVKNYHEYFGQDAKWSVSYAYETLVGPGLQNPYGQLVFKYNGKKIGQELFYTIESGAGTQQLKYMNPQGNVIRLNVDPTEKGYDTTESQVKVTIQWDGGKDTLFLAKRK